MPFFHKLLSGVRILYAGTVSYNFNYNNQFVQLFLLVAKVSPYIGTKKWPQTRPNWSTLKKLRKRYQKYFSFDPP